MKHGHMSDAHFDTLCKRLTKKHTDAEIFRDNVLQQLHVQQCTRPIDEHSELGYHCGDMVVQS